MLKEWVLEQFVTGVNSGSSRTLRSKSKKNGDSVIKKYKFKKLKLNSNDIFFYMGFKYELNCTTYQCLMKLSKLDFLFSFCFREISLCRCLRRLASS